VFASSTELMHGIALPGSLAMGFAMRWTIASMARAVFRVFRFELTLCVCQSHQGSPWIRLISRWPAPAFVGCCRSSRAWPLRIRCRRSRGEFVTAVWNGTDAQGGAARAGRYRIDCGPGQVCGRTRRIPIFGGQTGSHSLRADTAGRTALAHCVAIADRLPCE